jgi:plasmid replication initiation protein
MDSNKSEEKETNEEIFTKELFLKKHVAMIHCENKLTLLQRKVCNILLYNALSDIDTKNSFEISVKELSSLVGYKSNDVKHIQESLLALLPVIMEWNLLSDKTFVDKSGENKPQYKWGASTLLAGVEIENGLISYSYSEQLKKILINQEIYGRINLFVQSKFNSSYSLVLYENCVRFKNIHHTPWINLALFKALMGVTNDKYALFKDFNKYVITVAMKEINLKSDIFLNIEYRKKGRRISEMRFLINDNENYKPVFKKLRGERKEFTKNANQINYDLLNILTDGMGISIEEAKKILHSYDEENILNKIKYVKSKKNIKNIRSYFITALEKNYDNNNSKNFTSNDINNVNKINQVTREVRKPNQVIAFNEKYLKYKFDEYNRIFMSSADHEKLHILFMEFLSPTPLIANSYKYHKFAHRLVMLELIKFMENSFRKRVAGILSFEDFISAEEVVCD